MKLVWQFRTKHRKRYLEMLENVSDKNVIILRNRTEVRRFLNDVTE